MSQLVSFSTIKTQLQKTWNLKLSRLRVSQSWKTHSICPLIFWLALVALDTRLAPRDELQELVSPSMIDFLLSMDCYFDVWNCRAHAQIFSLSKHCASPACQLNCLWSKQHKNTDTGILVWQLTLCPHPLKVFHSLPWQFEYGCHP